MIQRSNYLDLFLEICEQNSTISFVLRDYGISGLAAGAGVTQPGN